jgi:cytochrome c peroxidase
MTIGDVKRIRLKRFRLWLRGRARLLTVALPLLAALGVLLSHSVRTLGDTARLHFFPNQSGYLATFSTTGSIQSVNNPFFQSLGTNGRSCATCHVAGDAWSVTPAHLQQRFEATRGTDPIFRPVDGSNCSNSPGVNRLPPSKSAYSLLLDKGLIRISLAIPANAQFTVQVVSDPYGCAETTDSTGQMYLSMYRRPLPATNLGFLSTVMFDGRENIQPLNSPATFQTNLNVDLTHQAVDAVATHAQGVITPTNQQLQQIVAFELSTFTAQQFDFAAGDLDAHGAHGGPAFLSATSYYPGINDPLGGNPTGAPFDPNAFALFAPWQNLAKSDPRRYEREAIARGEVLFNTAPVTIQDVKGLNDALGLTTIVGTCTTCHDTPSVGDHSLPLPLDIGISDVPASPSDPVASALAELNPPRTPVFQFTCSTQLGAPSNLAVQTTDPGRAMITGHCADIGKFKGPILHGLAGHAPYFQNGSADSLDQVVNFYNQRFQMGLTANEMADLVSFLNSL